MTERFFVEEQPLLDPVLFLAGSLLRFVRAERVLVRGGERFFESPPALPAREPVDVDRAPLAERPPVDEVAATFDSVVAAPAVARSKPSLGNTSCELAVFHKLRFGFRITTPLARGAL